MGSTESQRRRREDLRERGLCIAGDGLPAAAGGLCADCAERSRAAGAAYRERRARGEGRTPAPRPGRRGPAAARAAREPAAPLTGRTFEVTVKVRNNLLKERRVATGLSQPAFAKLAGVSPNWYNQLECLRSSPLRSNGRWRRSALLLADFHGVAPEELWPDAVLAVRSPEVTRKVDADALLALAAAAPEPESPALPDADLDRGELAAAVRRLLGTLPAREESVVRLRFGIDCDPHTFTEIADLEGVSGARAQQIVSNALEKLQHPSRTGAVEPWR